MNFEADLYKMYFNATKLVDVIIYGTVNVLRALWPLNFNKNKTFSVEFSL